MSLETLSGGARAASSTAAPASAPSASTSSASTAASAMPLALVSTTLSDEMRSLFDGQKKLHDQILKLQTQIEEEEASYLEETAHGNIMRGWDGFIDSKQSRKEAALKKVKPYTDSEHLFSGCCFYKTLRGEPLIELADYHPRDESSASRRRAAAAAAGNSASSGSSSSVGSRPSGSSSSSVTKTPILERKASFSGGSAGSATGTATLGRPPKIKKRKRLDRLEFASTASATQSEAGDDDDKELPLTTPSLKKSRSLSTSETTEGGDFADML